MIAMKRLNDTLFLEVLRSRAQGTRLETKAFFSSFLDGITTEPHHMIVPIDDHMVHRGDAVFEAVKFQDGFVYALDRHLERLEVSMRNIAMPAMVSTDELKKIILETVRASGLTTGLIRLFIARGPGGFTTNPYETIGTQVYCAITTLKSLAKEKYENGVTVGWSSVAVKEGMFARTKTCNYLPNVLMKKEALDRGIDFVVSLDEKQFVAEGSTENFAIIDGHGRLIVPKFDRILRGITAVRALELAEEIGIGGETKLFTKADVENARGAVMLGTTLDILPIGKIEENDSSAHDFGGIAKEVRALQEAFQKDLTTGPLRTKVKD